MDNLFYIISASSFSLLVMVLLIIISFTTLKKREKIFNKISKNRKND